MKLHSLSSLSEQALVDEFARLALAQDEALLDDDIAGYNRLFKKMNVFDKELRSRGADARRSLVVLFNHPNMQVRLRAAHRLLAVLPNESMEVLRAIKASGVQPYAMDAGMSLRGLADGSYVPD